MRLRLGHEVWACLLGPGVAQLQESLRLCAAGRQLEEANESPGLTAVWPFLHVPHSCSSWHKRAQENMACEQR